MVVLVPKYNDRLFINIQYERNINLQIVIIFWDMNYRQDRFLPIWAHNGSSYPEI